MSTARAPLTCPSCGHKVTGRWLTGEDTADQRCRTCGHVFEAAWPGFCFEPETVTLSPAGEEPGDDAA